MAFYLKGKKRWSRHSFGSLSALMVASVALLAVLLCPSGSAAASQGKRVLFINSYHHGFEWSDDLMLAFRSRLTELGIKIDLSVEFMDTKRLAGKRTADTFRQLIASKYRNQALDAIIVSDDNAYQFALANRRELFPRVPIVFIGVNDFVPEELEGHREFVTGIVQRADVFETAQVALDQNPERTHLLLVHDGSPTGIGYEKFFRRELPRLLELYPGLSVEYLTGKDHSTTEMLNRLKLLPDYYVVVLPVWISGRDGELVPYLESFEKVSAHSAVPVYSPAGPGLDHGMVGGKVTTGAPHGRAGADVIARILEGAGAGSIPIETDSVNYYMFDARQLKRWKIDRKRLPEGAVIINEESSIFKEHGHIILPLFGFLLLQTLLILILSVNIRKRKLAEERMNGLNKALKNSEERLELALAGANDGVWDWYVESNRIHFDPGYYTMAGYTPYEFPENFVEWEKRIHPDDIDQARQVIDQYLSKKIDEFNIEFRFLKKDGLYMWIRGKGKIVAYDEEGYPLRFVGTHSDISDLKEAEEGLRNLQNYLANIINSMPSVLIGVDCDNRVTQWNLHATRISGVPADEAVGLPLSEALSWSDVIVELVARAIESGHEQEVVRQERLVADKVVYENVTVYPLVANGADGAVIRIDDVTRQAQLEEQLSHGRKMEAVGTLAGGVAHDFNNMLGGIIGAAEVLAFSLPDDATTRKYHQAILDSAERAADLTKKLLAFSKATPQASTVFDVHQVIRDTETLLENVVDKKVVIEIDLAAERAGVVGDPSHIQSVLLNLGINASHAMPDGGTLALTTRQVELDRHYCEASVFNLVPGSYLELEVRDTGTGIPPEVLDKIFDPFFTTKKQGQGTGLGLASVYGTVQQHGGSIHVYSEPGVGTTFSILLPLSGVDLAAKSVHPQLQRGEGRILVVDDESVMRVTAKAILEELGYEVAVAENGEEGVEAFRESGGSFDLVLLDMIMPVMNGRECFAQLQQLDPDVKVVLSSGFGREEDILGMKNDGLIGFIRKPYRSSALSQVVHDALAKPDGEGDSH